MDNMRDLLQVLAVLWGVDVPTATLHVDAFVTLQLLQRYRGGGGVVLHALHRSVLRRSLRVVTDSHTALLTAAARLLVGDPRLPSAAFQDVDWVAGVFGDDVLRERAVTKPMLSGSTPVAGGSPSAHISGSAFMEVCLGSSHAVPCC